MRFLKTILPLAVLAFALGAGPVYAHGFGERTELPVPLAYFLLGSGAVVALSFVIMGVFVKGAAAGPSYFRFDLLRYSWLGAVLTNRVLGTIIKSLSVFLLALVVATGLFGTQTPSANFAPSFVWIIWWVGMAYVVALLGNAGP